jgi:hypothetical protein
LLIKANELRVERGFAPIQRVEIAGNLGGKEEKVTDMKLIYKLIIHNLFLITEIIIEEALLNLIYFHYFPCVCEFSLNFHECK